MSTEDQKTKILFANSLPEKVLRAKFLSLHEVFFMTQRSYDDFVKTVTVLGKTADDVWESSILILCERLYSIFTYPLCDEIKVGSESVTSDDDRFDGEEDTLWDKVLADTQIAETGCTSNKIREMVGLCDDWKKILIAAHQVSMSTYDKMIVAVRDVMERKMIFYNSFDARSACECLLDFTELEIIQLGLVVPYVLQSYFKYVKQLIEDAGREGLIVDKKELMDKFWNLIQKFDCKLFFAERDFLLGCMVEFLPSVLCDIVISYDVVRSEEEVERRLRKLGELD